MLDEAKKIFFPGGKSGHAKEQKLEFCECSLGNFTGTPLSLKDADFSISRYLSDNGLFASRVTFYLLTTAKNRDDLENIDSSCESVENALSSSNESSGNVVKSATDSGVESVSKGLLHIGDSKKSFVLEFCRHEISHYTSEASSLSTSYPGSLPTPGAAAKTLVGAGHVNLQILRVNRISAFLLLREVW